jgi:hypothetical protein
MLFHVVNVGHLEKRSMIFTTNKPLSAWGHVLHDEDVAQAIVDRVLERGRLLLLDGPSMRTKHLGLDHPLSAEASTQGPEFPEFRGQNFRNPHPGGRTFSNSTDRPSLCFASTTP